MTAQVQVNDTGSTVTVTVTEATVGVGIPSAVSHSAISGRTAAYSHPTSAITGLDAALAAKQPLDADLTGLASDYTAATKALVCNHCDAATSAGLHIGNQAHQDVAMFGAGGSQGTTLYGQLNCLAVDSTSASGILTRAAATQDAIALAGRAGGTSSYTGTLTPAVLSASRTWTLPNATGTVPLLELAQTFSALQTFSNGLTVSSGTTALQAATCTTLTATANLIRDDVIGTDSTIGWNIGGLRSWAIGRTATAKDFSFINYDAGGAYLSQPLIIRYATGNAEFAAGVTCTTLTASGLLDLTTSTGVKLRATGATTAYRSFQIGNTGGDLQFGVESSTAGGTFYGSAAYDAVLYVTSPRLYTFAASHYHNKNNSTFIVADLGVPQFTIAASGAAAFSAGVTCTTLGVTGQITCTTASAPGVTVGGPVDAVFGHSGAFNTKLICNGVTALTIEPSARNATFSAGVTCTTLTASGQAASAGLRSSLGTNTYWSGSAFVNDTVTTFTTASSFTKAGNSTPGCYDSGLALFGAQSDGTMTLVGSFGQVGMGTYTAGNLASQISDLYITSRDTTGAQVQRMRFKSDGAVLVGTDPGGAETLRVGGAARVSGQMVIGAALSMSHDQAIYAGGSATANLRCYFDAGNSYWRAPSGGHVWQNEAGTNRMTLSSAGALDVAAAATVKGLTSTVAGIAATFDSGAASDARIEFKRNGVRQGLFSWDTGTVTFEGDTVASSVILFRSGGAERARVKNTGQIRFVPLSSDPGGLEDGDVWYNSTANKLRVRAGGATVDLH
jgi:hypothetical protein